MVHTLSIPNHSYSWVDLLHSKKAISRDSLNTLPINPYPIYSEHFTRESHAHTPYQSLTVGTLFHFNQSEASWIESIQSEHLTRFIHPHPINPYPIYSKHFTRESHGPLQSKTHSFTLKHSNRFNRATQRGSYTPYQSLIIFTRVVSLHTLQSI